MSGTIHSELALTVHFVAAALAGETICDATCATCLRRAKPAEALASHGCEGYSGLWVRWDGSYHVGYCTVCSSMMPRTTPINDVASVVRWHAEHECASTLPEWFEWEWIIWGGYLVARKDPEQSEPFFDILDFDMGKCDGRTKRALLSPEFREAMRREWGKG